MGQGLLPEQRPMTTYRDREAHRYLHLLPSCHDARMCGERDRLPQLSQSALERLIALPNVYGGCATRPPTAETHQPMKGKGTSHGSIF